MDQLTDFQKKIFAEQSKVCLYLAHAGLILLGEWRRSFLAKCCASYCVSSDIKNKKINKKHMGFFISKVMN